MINVRLACILSLFRNEINKFDNTGAQMSVLLVFIIIHVIRRFLKEATFMCIALQISQFLVSVRTCPHFAYSITN